MTYDTDEDHTPTQAKHADRLGSASSSDLERVVIIDLSVNHDNR